MQGTKNRPQIATPGFILQPHLPTVELLLQPRDRVIEVFGTIVDGCVRKRYVPLILHNLPEQQDAAEREGG
jgi:hypothetical protein